MPPLINYQGRVAIGSTNFDGSGQFKFALVNAAGTTAYWTNDGTHLDGTEPASAVMLTVSKGLYSVLLGDTSLANMTIDLPTSIFTNSDVRLRVWFNDGINGSQQLAPDQRIASVGYAMVAVTVPDSAISTNKLADNAVTSTKIDSTSVQRRVTGAAPAGTFIKAINADGTIVVGAAGNGTVTSIAAGTGLTGGPITSSGTLSVDHSAVQARVTGSAPAGTFMRAINADGSIVVGAAGNGTVTSVAAGTGLTGGPITSSGTLNVDTTAVQARVTGSAPAGSFIRGINADGSIVVGAAANGTVTSIAAGTGLTGGPITSSGTLSVDHSAVQARVTGSAPGGTFIRAINADGSIVASAAVISIAAGTGLIGGPITSSGTLSVDPAVVQARVTGSAPTGTFIKAINVDGTIVVGADANSGGTVTSASAVLDFPSTAAQSGSDLPITLAGATDGDSVSLGVASAAILPHSCYTAWVSAPNTVTVRLNNYSAGAQNPASATFRVTVTRL